MQGGWKKVAGGDASGRRRGRETRRDAFKVLACCAAEDMAAEQQKDFELVNDAREAAAGSCRS